jgi:putative FmdB family regulatory protein
MPTYEYECTHCGHSFELFQNITAKPLDKCPKCHKEVKRLIGAGSAIIFSRSWRDSAKAEKGSGFYATDYRKKPKGDSAKTKTNACPKAGEGCNACQKSE